MAGPRLRPLFVAKRSYRLRRLRDAVRMLPFLGAFLFVLPLLWVPTGQARDLARDAVYLFLAWGALIAIAAFLAHRLAVAGHDADDPASAEDAE